MRQASLKKLGFFFVFLVSTASACHQKGVGGQSTESRHKLTAQYTTEVAPKTTEPGDEKGHAFEIKRVARLIVGNPKQNCAQIKKDPNLLKLYHQIIGGQQDPTSEDVKLIRITAVALTDPKKFKLQLGKKVTHPVFDRRPDLKPFLQKRIAQYDPSFNIDKPLNKEGKRAIIKLRELLVQLAFQRR